MDTESPSPPGTPAAPLQAASSDRVNVQRHPSAMLSARDSSVHEKISQFNTLAVQSKQLERKTADAALKRAMLGREEAEADMRRYRDEARALRKQVEEGKERERRVGERLETVMENYGRAKETHAHTQALWEKEIRRARKETFKSQSVIVKLQEELKSARAAAKAAEEGLALEKERSKAREQEAFSARYNIVGVEEQLQQAQERIRVVEQERDAFKTLAKSEEDVAKIAAEGRLPLPRSVAAEGEEDEFASPKKKEKRRVSSISIMDVKSSAPSEAEFEELALMMRWEKQRADRALEHLDYLQAECHLRACRCMKTRPRNSTIGEPRRHNHPDILDIVDAGDHAILSDKAPKSLPKREPSPAKKPRMENIKTRAEPRRSTIFVPEEGVFRTVSQEEADAMALASASVSAPIDADSPTRETIVEPITPMEAESLQAFVRTPSVEPPSCAMLTHQRASLLSLLDAPHQVEPPMKFNIPTTAGVTVVQETRREIVEMEVELNIRTETPERAQNQPLTESSRPLPEPELDGRPETPNNGTQRTMAPVPQTRETTPEEVDTPIEDEEEEEEMEAAYLNQPPRPHTSAAHYGSTAAAAAMTTTTTKVPLREENTDPSLASRLMALQRTPSSSSSGGGARPGGSKHGGPHFDTNNPALTPTMTREQALAQIRERRGRARSAMGGAVVTPRKISGPAMGERRGVSAPVPGRVGVGGVGGGGGGGGGGVTGSVRRAVRT